MDSTPQPHANYNGEASRLLRIWVPECEAELAMKLFNVLGKCRDDTGVIRWRLDSAGNGAVCLRIGTVFLDSYNPRRNAEQHFDVLMEFIVDLMPSLGE